MNISPISNFSYKTLNFKANFTINPNKDETESLQNNNSEVKISPEAYCAMHVNKIFDNMQEEGIITKNDDDSLDISEEFDVVNPDNNIADISADMAIMGLKASASGLSSQFASLDDIPTFMKIDYNNYIAKLEQSINEGKAQIAAMDLPDNEDLPDFEDMLEMDENSILDYSMQKGFAMLPEIFEMQSSMLQLLKTTKAQKLKEALEECSNAYNALLYNAILHGFKGDARAVVGDLTNNIEIYAAPEITENDDGTTTYTYQVFTTVYTITKNSKNGDYISANSKGLDGCTNFMIDFNLDGSIKQLDYVDNINKSIISISQKDNRVSVKQTSNGVVSQRTFIKTPDEKLKQTSMNISVYQ